MLNLALELLLVAWLAFVLYLILKRLGG